VFALRTTALVSIVKDLGETSVGSAQVLAKARQPTTVIGQLLKLGIHHSYFVLSLPLRADPEDTRLGTLPSSTPSANWGPGHPTRSTVHLFSSHHAWQTERRLLRLLGIYLLPSGSWLSTPST